MLNPYVHIDKLYILCLMSDTDNVQQLSLLSISFPTVPSIVERVTMQIHAVIVWMTLLYSNLYPRSGTETTTCSLRVDVDIHLVYSATPWRKINILESYGPLHHQYQHKCLIYCHVKA
jgi:hypothetical protein